MVEAMEAVKSGRLGVNRAANEYNVPRTTLKDKLAGRVKHGTKSGQQSYLTVSEENKLSNFLIEVCKMGHGKTKKKVIDIARRTVKKKWKRKVKILSNLNLKGRDGGKHLAI